MLLDATVYNAGIHRLQYEAITAIGFVRDAVALEAFRQKYLGIKGAIRSAVFALDYVDDEDRKRCAETLNEARKAIYAAFDAKRTEVC